MIWYALIYIVVWLVKLPLFLLPNSSFLALPEQVTTAIITLGGYSRWFIYLLGNSVGDALVVSISFLLPLMIFALSWRGIFKIAKWAVGLVARARP